jgi:hypothetical protein
MVRLFLAAAFFTLLIAGTFADKEYEEHGHGHSHDHHHHDHDGRKFLHIIKVFILNKILCR